MLKPFRRHSTDCKFASKGRSHIRCGCPIWVDGTPYSKRHLASWNTRNWEHAQQRQ